MLDDRFVDELAAEPALTLLCGRYEGFDERIVQHFCVGRGLDRALRAVRRRARGDGRRATPSCASCRARSATPTPPPRSPSAPRSAATPSTRTTRARPSTAAGGCPRCSCRATTRRSAAGGARAAASVAAVAPRAVRYHEPPARAVLLTAARGLLAMSTVIDSLERAQLRRVPHFRAGDRVRVHFQVIEGTRRRTQVFEGVVIKRQGHGARETFTVRKQSFGVGVERTFPVHSPKIEKIEVAARGDVRRAKLYYLRDRVGKRARVRERRYTGPEESSSPGCCTIRAEALEAEAARSDRGGRRRGRDGHGGRRRGRRGGHRGRARDRRRRHRRRTPLRPTTPRPRRRARRGRGRRRPRRRPRASPPPTTRRDRRSRSRRAARSSSWSSSSRSRSASRSASRPSSSSRTGSRASRWSRRSRSASACSSTASATASATRRSATSSSSTRRPGSETRHVRRPPGATTAPPATGRRRGRSSVNFIKRVVAGPGDTIAIVDGHVIRNGKREKEPFIRTRARTTRTGVHVPDADHDSARTTGS